MTAEGSSFSAVANAGPIPPFRLANITDPNAAIGAAARLMMNHRAFAERGFGEWMQVLDGQARRGHQVFVLDAADRLVGFFGYAISPDAIAAEWAEGRYSPNDAECRAGDSLIFNAWIAEDRAVLDFMWNAFRRLARGKTAAYFKRFYPNGKTRPGRLKITAAVEGHIQRADARAHGRSASFSQTVA